MKYIRISLRAEVVLLAFTIVVVSLAAVGLSVYWTLQTWTYELVGRQLMALAHLVASDERIQEGFDAPSPPSVIQPLTEEIRGLTGVKFITVFNLEGVRHSHFRPELIGQRFTGGDEGPALQGASYVSKADGVSGRSMRAFVPIYNARGERVGAVAVGTFDVNMASLVREGILPLWPAVLLSLGLGATGAVLLARRIKRTILGLEPGQITALVSQRETILNSVREGVVACDAEGRITLINERARELLSPAAEPVGRTVEDVIPNTGLRRVVATGEPELDEQHVIGDRIILTNRMPLLSGGRVIGAVATFRDKSEVQKLAEELTGVRRFVDGLRAQAHEHANKLQTLSGLLSLREYAEAQAFIQRDAKSRQDMVTRFARAVREPAVAGLLIGKASEAIEAGIQLRLEKGSRLSSPVRGPLDAGALVTILGNLLENAIEALRHQERPLRRISLLLSETDSDLHLMVTDTGPGMDPDLSRRCLLPGVSTKPGFRGLGLALVRRLVSEAGGQIRIESAPGSGTTVAITIPLASPARR